MLTDEKGKRLNKYVSDYCVFDLETTGISAYTDQVVEISAVKVMAGKVVDEFSTLVNPLRHIPAQASRVNGITDAMVKDAPTFESALKDFLDFAGDMILVGHNIHSFDMKFIYRDAFTFYGKVVGNDYIDTLILSRRCLKQLRHHTLTDLSAYYGINTEGAHRALNDCRMNQQVFERLGQEMISVEPEEERACKRCGCIMKKRNGKFGEFWGCTGYPDCRYTENI